MSGKGGKTRYLPLHPGTNGLINDYLEAAGLGADKGGALFRPLRNNRTGKLERAITADGVYRLVRAYSAQLGFEIGAHALRATAATNALDHQADIAKVQEWLGHANIATARIYDHRRTRPEDSPTFKVSYGRGHKECVGVNHEAEDVAGKKVPVKGGGVCIYCGWDGGKKGLGDEHCVPYSLGGNTELLKASCSDCEAITSYLDGYLANAIFGHMRVHMGLQSRSGHPETLPAIIELEDGQRAVDLATGDHPYLLNMPIWRPPGFMIGRQLSEGFGNPGRFTYWYMPPNLRDVIGLKDGDIARLTDTSRPHNLSTFARGLMKIAYCNAVMKYGLDGFRPLAARDIILGRYPNIAFFVGSDPTTPSPPYPRGRQHSVSLGSITYTHTKFLTATIRLFGDSGAGDKEDAVLHGHLWFGGDASRRREGANVAPATPNCALMPSKLVAVDLRARGN